MSFNPNRLLHESSAERQTSRQIERQSTAPVFELPVESAHIEEPRAESQPPVESLEKPEEIVARIAQISQHIDTMRSDEMRDAA